MRSPSPSWIATTKTCRNPSVLLTSEAWGCGEELPLDPEAPGHRGKALLELVRGERGLVKSPRQLAEERRVLVGERHRRYFAAGDGLMEAAIASR